MNKKNMTEYKCSICLQCFDRSHDAIHCCAYERGCKHLRTGFVGIKADTLQCLDCEASCEAVSRIDPIFQQFIKMVAETAKTNGEPWPDYGEVLNVTDFEARIRHLPYRRRAIESSTEQPTTTNS